MNVAEQVTRELHREADRVEVDVAALHARTRDRIDERAGRMPATRRRVLPLAAAVLLLVVALGSGWALLVKPGSPSADRSATSTRGTVEDHFSCEHRTRIDFTKPQQDDAFLPTLEDGPAGFARLVQAPRWSYAVDGDTSTLLLGNADGSLASRTTFVRTSGTFEPRLAELCTGADNGIVDPDGAGRLRSTGVRPYGPRGMVQDPDLAVLVDDRTYYDASGFRRHRSMWAAPCGRALCVSAGRPTSYVAGEARLDAGKPALQDLSDLFLPPDDLVGKKQTLGLWVVYDPDRTLTGVHARGARGQQLADGVRVAGPGWTGQAFFVLAAKADVVDVAMESSGDMTSTPTGP